MQIHIKGVSEYDRESVREAILSVVHKYGINYDLWTWDWEDPVEITDNDGNIVGEGANVELPGTAGIRDAVHQGLLEDISKSLPGIAVYILMAPVEASFDGKRL